MDETHHHARLVVSPASRGTICVAGELDAATGPVLASALADPDVRNVDLAAVTFVDAAGLRVLLAADRARTDRGGLTLLAPSEPLLRLLALVDLHLATDPG